MQGKKQENSGELSVGPEDPFILVDSERALTVGLPRPLFLG